MAHDRNMHDTVVSLLQQAGDEIVMPAYHSRSSTRELKEDGSVVTETDLKCQQFLEHELAALFPGIAFLGEEMSIDEQLACLSSGDSFWCVDPLDGTSNFTIPFPHFALSLSLVKEGKPVLACIHDPLRSETFTAVKGSGAQLNGEPIRASERSELSQAVGFIDFKRLDSELGAKLAISRIFRSQRNIGTCALEWAWLAAGRAHFIIHGSEKIWDYAAGSLLAEEAGCSISGFDGSHPFKSVQLSSSILAASCPDLHTKLLDLL